jgi:hypothetical protein
MTTVDLAIIVACYALFFLCAGLGVWYLRRQHLRGEARRAEARADAMMDGLWTDEEPLDAGDPAPEPSPAPESSAEPDGLRRRLIQLDEDWPLAVRRPLPTEEEFVVVRGRAHPEGFGIAYTLDVDEHRPIGPVEILAHDGDCCRITPPGGWTLEDGAVEELYQAAMDVTLPVDDLSFGEAPAWLAQFIPVLPEPRPGWRREAALAATPHELLALVEEAFAVYLEERQSPEEPIATDESVAARVLPDERVAPRGDALLVFLPELPPVGFRGVVRIDTTAQVPIAENLMDIRQQDRRRIVLVPHPTVPDAMACPTRGRLAIVESMRRIFGEWVELGVHVLDPVQLTVPYVRDAYWSATYEMIAHDGPVEAPPAPPRDEPVVPARAWPGADPRPEPLTVPPMRRLTAPRWPTARQLFWAYDLPFGLCLTSDGLAAASDGYPHGRGVEIVVPGPSAAEIPLWQGLTAMAVAEIVAGTPTFASLLSTHQVLSVELTADFRVAEALPPAWRTDTGSVGVLLGLPVPGVPELIAGDVRLVSVVLLGPEELARAAAGPEASRVLRDELLELDRATWNPLDRFG